MADEVLERIRETLSQAGVDYREISHAPTHTSEESARVRGESLSVGAKALLLKADDSFRLFVLPADRQLDTKKRTKKYRNDRQGTELPVDPMRGQVKDRPGHRRKGTREQ